MAASDQCFSHNGASADISERYSCKYNIVLFSGTNYIKQIFH